MDKIRQLLGKLPKARPCGFWPGFLVGIIYFSYIFWWFWSVSPLLLSGTGNKLSLLIILLPFLITVSGMSFFWGLFSFCLYNFRPKTRFIPLFCGGTFVLLEYLRSWFFGILWFGNGSSLGAHWTLGNPAYLFAGSGFLRHFSSYWGIYGTDFLIVLVSTGFFILFRRRGKIIPVMIIFAAVFLLLWSDGYF